MLIITENSINLLSLNIFYLPLNASKIVFGPPVLYNFLTASLVLQHRNELQLHVILHLEKFARVVTVFFSPL